MITFLFWNLGKKPLQEIIANLAVKYDVDVFMFAECPSLPFDPLLALNSSSNATYHYARGICKKIKLYTRFADSFIKPVGEADRVTIRHLTLPGLTDILLAVVHLPSKRYFDEESQAVECRDLASFIRQEEQKIGHTRTMLVGDFNMNPFEDVIVSTDGLHAVMTKQIARKGQRTVQKKTYPFFYNPMWSFFGDISAGPPGTYYYPDTTHKAYFWNMFDQVLIRPGLLDNLGDVEIVHTDGFTSLISSEGVPDTAFASDHLPLLFRLQL